MTVHHPHIENEFAGLPVDRPVNRRWVNVITGGHVSAVVWGPGAPEVVLLHDAGASARSWDAVLAALDHPAAALDLPGHGRSNGEPADVDSPVRAARPVVEAIRSFAPRHRAIAGSGLGALVALAAAERAPAAVHRLLLVDTLPDPSADERLWAVLAGRSEPPVLIRAQYGDTSDDAVSRFRREVPAAVVVTVGGAGHDIATDRPEALAGAIAAQLTDEEPTG
ncbi:alpha/beta fold hydrolase [Actinoplanes sp. CA-030573]|uniref:alpha/beta fold hydrolase n=1 Tax=Actinoplanes sp. CA-030573 TaxID=3239898 RepID=UPI003D8E91F1